MVTERDGAYEKAEGEDEASMALGLTGSKGRVHLHFCKKVKWKTEEGERDERVVASLVDKAIYGGYHVYPNQVLSAKHLGIDVEVEVKISDSDIEALKQD